MTVPHGAQPVCLGAPPPTTVDAGRAMWFGPATLPLFGRLYLTAQAEARSGIVLCPPLGTEAQATARAYRRLGEMLAEHGFAVLQFDYPGTGDSADPDPGTPLVEQWQRSVEIAVESLRSAGSKEVSIIAMRLGATLAASVAAKCRLADLVLWDPCEDGRTYLREQHLLHQVYLEREGIVDRPTNKEISVPDGTFEALGTVYDERTVQGISGLSLSGAPAPLARRVLLLQRPGRRPRPATTQRLSNEDLEVAEAGQQEELLSVWPLKALVPHETLELVATWLEQGSAPGRTQISFSTTSSVRLRADDGSELEEEVRALGPHKLFAIISRPARGTHTDTVLLLNAGKLDHIGPGRLWVETARRWASAGLQVVRADLSGIGDSPPRDGYLPDTVYSKTARQDIAEMATALLPGHEPHLVLMGLCSGGYHAITAAATTGPSRVLAINPQWPQPAPPWPPSRRLDPHRAATWRQRRARVLALTKARARSLPWYDAIKSARSRLLNDPRWWLTVRLGHQQRPVSALARLTEHDGTALLVCREYEASMVARGDHRRLRRLTGTGNVDMVIMPDIDNSLYLARARARVLPVLETHVLGLPRLVGATVGTVSRAETSQFDKALASGLP